MDNEYKKKYLKYKKKYLKLKGGMLNLTTNAPIAPVTTNNFYAANNSIAPEQIEEFNSEKFIDFYSTQLSSEIKFKKTNTMETYSDNIDKSLKVIEGTNTSLYLSSIAMFIMAYKEIGITATTGLFTIGLTGTTGLMTSGMYFL